MHIEEKLKKAGSEKKKTTLSHGNKNKKYESASYRVLGEVVAESPLE